MSGFSTILHYASIGVRAHREMMKDIDKALAERDEEVAYDIDQMFEEALQRESDWFDGRMDADVVDRFYKHEIQVVEINKYPDSDWLECYEIDELKHDLSQGTGNVISRYFYAPAIDALLHYVDF